MLNRCEFIGRVGREIEVRTTNDGSTVVNVSLAVSEKWRDRNSGEQKERTEWIRVVSFNEGLNKVFQQCVKKGDLIRVVGQIQTRKWTDQQGVEKYSTEIVLQKYRGELTMLGGVDRASEVGTGTMTNNNQYSVHNDLDNEIPF